MRLEDLPGRRRRPPELDDYGYPIRRRWRLQMPRALEGAAGALDRLRGRRSSSSSSDYGYALRREGLSRLTLAAILVLAVLAGAWLGHRTSGGGGGRSSNDSATPTFAAPTTDASFRARLPTVVSALGAVRAKVRGQLAGTSDPPEQAAAASALAAAYREAAGQLKAAQGRQTQRRKHILAAMLDAAAAYDRLALAARASDADAFARAGKSVIAAEASVEQLVSARGSIA